MRHLLTAAAVVVAVASCGSGTTSTGSSPGPSPVTPSTTAPGGLVGTIDRARVLALCENARQAQTVLETGMGAPSVDPFLSAAADLLERPPVVAVATTLAARVRRDLRVRARADAVAALTAFCRTNGA